jgi:Fanconi anemia group D2 protein
VLRARVLYCWLVSDLDHTRTPTPGPRQVIGAVDKAKDHRMIDIFVLLMIHELISHKKATEALFLKKAKKGLLTPELVQMTFAKHWTAARKFFRPLLSVAEYLMRSADPTAREVAGAIYADAFRRFEPYCKQEVLGALITHIGSSSFVEVSHASIVALIDSTYRASAAVREFHLCGV